jgi:hypothetical protein
MKKCNYILPSFLTYTNTNGKMCKYWFSYG